MLPHPVAMGPLDMLARMSSATGLKTTDGQRLSVRMAALCSGSTHFLNLAARRPSAPLRAALEQTFVVVGGPHAGDASSRDLQVDGDAGARIDARLYEPAGVGPSAGLLVYFHGGGWAVGSVTSHDRTCRFLAKEAGVKVLSVEYRLAPEHPFPAAYEDARAAFAWAVAHASELGVDADRIGVGGDSAGGNLAAAVALDGSGGTRPAMALLIYPLVDCDVSRYASTRLFARGPLLSRRALLDFIGHYAPSPREQLDPRVSPIDAENLGDMPPTYLCTAGMDPLRDQGERFAERLREAGVEAEHQRFDSLPHGFASLLIEPDAKRAAVAVAAAAGRGLRRSAQVAGAAT